MNSVPALRLDRTKQLHFVELIVAVAVGNAIQTGLHLLFEIIDDDIQSTKSPHHSVRSANVGGHGLHISDTQSLSTRRRSHSIQPAELIAGQQPAFVVGAEIDP